MVNALAELPTGTVTFLYTDIVGSTNMARKYPDVWPIFKARHHAILRDAIAAHHGYVFRTVGDEFNSAFGTALDALSAALDAQSALSGEDWGVIGSIHVRMGLHTGPARLINPEFEGYLYEGYLTLSHTKRLMSIAHGDQIILSEVTEALLHESLPAGVSLRDLGKHRLKDFDRAEHIFQVVAKDLLADFPPIKSLDVTPNNLPVQLSSFIGRSKEVQEIKQLLSTERLLTLTGPSGSGKTRLGLQVATEVIDLFQDGVFFVALAPIIDPVLVPSTIAQSLGISESPGQSVMESLRSYLGNKSMLLLLDNFEQVIKAAPYVAELLAACLEMKIMVTSREILHISGEHEYPVPPLGLPNLDRLPPVEALSQYAAVDLFIQRARSIKSDFQITKDIAPAIAEICYRLDGLPLAIELAAVRIKLLPPPAMLARLEHRLEILTGGGRDLPERQQTLRNAIAWSYDQLNEHEQRLFRRLSIFIGGCSLDAIEAIVEDESNRISLLDLLGSLIDKSLLKEVEDVSGESRFVMLETLREFGLEQLQASGELDSIHRRHADFYLALAEKTEIKPGSTGQVQWISLMDQDHGNLRSALEWSMTAEGMEDHCLRFADALGLFWEARGYYSEGRERLSAILMTKWSTAWMAGRARLLTRAAELAYRQSDYPATKTFAWESLRIFREVGDKQGIASALIKLGNAATEMGDYRAAAEFLEEALKTWREIEDKHGVARALISLGWVALRFGNFRVAKPRLSEALTISRALDDTRSMGFELSGLGEVALRQGDYHKATQLVNESLEMRRRLGNKWGIGVSLGILAWIAMREENWEQANERLSESLEVRWEIGDQSGIAWCFERMGAVAQALGQAEKATRLFAAGTALRASIRSVIDPADKPAYESKIRALRAELGKERFNAIWNEAKKLTLQQAVSFALTLNKEISIDHP